MNATKVHVMDRFAVKLLCLTVILFICSALRAQSFYGSIVGTVTDASGALVPNAKVVVTNVGTNESTTVNTDSGGKFSFVNLIPATYKVDITKASFKRFLRDQVTVEVGSTIRVDEALQVGAASETVEISTEAPLLKTDSSTLSTEISAALVQEMPLNGRNVLNLIALTPGVVPTGAAMGSTGLNQGTRTGGGAGWGNYEIGGAIQGQSAQFIDGVANNLLGGNIVALVPTQDAIQEFSVASSNAGADFGRFAGGVVNMASKSGGNKFHGSVWEYLRNRDFNANDFFSNLNGSPRPQFNQNQYGASINGPIKRGKAFFMFTWEGYNALTGNLAPTIVPTTAMQNGSFTTALYGLSATATSNTTTNNPCNTGSTGPSSLNQATCVDTATNCTVAGPAAPGNPSPGSWTIVNLNTCGDPTNKIIKTFYPAPNVPNALPGQSNWFLTTPLGNKQNQYNSRVDYQLGAKDRLFARYTYWTLADTAHSEFLDQGFGGTTWPTNDGAQKDYTHQAVMGETHAFNATTISDIHINYVRQTSPNTAQSAGIGEAQFGPAFAKLAPQFPLQEIPGFQLNGSDLLYNMQNYTNASTTWYNTYGLNGNVTKIAGVHDIKVGGEGRLMDQSSFNNGGGGSGAFTYGNLFSGDEFANLLLGYPSQTTFKSVQRTAVYTYYQGYYGQDAWQVAKNLTLTLGLRYELPGAIAERNNKSAVLLPTTVDPYTGVTGTLALTNSALYGGRTGVQARYNLFAPRVGAAFRVTSKTVVRGGYGITYLPNDLSGTSPVNGNLTGANTSVAVPTNGTPIQLQTILNTIANGGVLPVTGQALPGGLIPSPGRTNPAFMTNFVSKTSYLGQSITGPIPNQPYYPWVEQWNMGISHEFMGNLMTEISYSGLHGAHMPGGSRQLNQLPNGTYTSTGTVTAAGAAIAGVPVGTALGMNIGVATVPGSNPPVPLYPYSCKNAPMIATMQVEQCLRQYPYYNGVSDGAGFYGIQNYRSIQMKAEKRMGALGTIIANYTYARSMGNVDTFNGFLESKAATQGGSISGGSIQDWTNLQADYSLISYDVTNRGIVAYNLSLPFGKGKKYGNTFSGPLDALVSGWAINGTTTLQSGFPIVFQTSTGSNISGAGSLRPMVVPGCQKKIDAGSLARVTSGANATGSWFNTGCFESPGANGANGTIKVNGVTTADPIFFSTYQFGNEPRVDPTLRADGIKNFDFSFQKSTSIGEGLRLQFRTEMFNVMNRVQFAPPGSQVGSTSFGQVSYQVNKPRQLQLSLRLNY